MSRAATGIDMITAKSEPLIEALNDADSILITTHRRPDGDALGSVRAMQLVLESLGKRVVPLILSPLTWRYEFLFPEKPLLVDDAEKLKLIPSTQLIMVVDTSATEQLVPVEGYLHEHHQQVVVADHHAGHEDIGQLVWIDIDAGAAGVMLLELIRQAQWPLSAEAASALLVAVGTDTGWFQYANADQRTFQAAADLVASGASADKLYQKIYLQDPPRRHRLLAAALNTLQLSRDQRIADMSVTLSMFRDCGAEPGDTDGVIDQMRSIGPVVVYILFVQESDDKVRVSFRSRDQVDVNALAATFGGGGHARAAGARVKGGMSEVRGQILKAVAKALPQ